MKNIILASASKIRKEMLVAAGIAIDAVSAFIDENNIKKKVLQANGNAGDATSQLAISKALVISERNEFKNSIVIGADQILECDDIWLDKPKNIEKAREQLEFLRGKTHRLWTSAAVIESGVVIWQHTEIVNLTMRDFSLDFLDKWLQQAGYSILQSVGAYQIEKTGIQLFDKIEGDYFSILGLPLLSLLKFLRKKGIIFE